LNTGYWNSLDFSRETSQSKTSTEYIGFFYCKPSMTRLQKISDHFLIECKFSTNFSGLKIDLPSNISRRIAITSASNNKSRCAKRINDSWPQIPFKEVAKGIIPLATKSIRIWSQNIKYEHLNSEFIKTKSIEKLVKAYSKQY